MTSAGHRKGHERHRGLTIRYRGKADSVYVECECGFVDCVAVWYDKPLPGWDKAQWPKLLRSIMVFLASLHDFTKAERVALDLAAGKPVKNTEVREALADVHGRADICQALLLKMALRESGSTVRFVGKGRVGKWLKRMLEHPNVAELEGHAATQLKALREIDDLGNEPVRRHM